MNKNCIVIALSIALASTVAHAGTCTINIGKDWYNAKSSGEILAKSEIISKCSVSHAPLDCLKTVTCSVDGWDFDVEPGDIEAARKKAADSAKEELNFHAYQVCANTQSNWRDNNYIQTGYFGTAPGPKDCNQLTPEQIDSYAKIEIPTLDPRGMEQLDAARAAILGPSTVSESKYDDSASEGAFRAEGGGY